MGTEIIKSFDSLRKELDQAKSSLSSLNNNIRRIIGRDQKDTTLRGDRKRQLVELRRNDTDRNGPRRKCDTSQPAIKRRCHDTKSVFNRLSLPTSSGVDVGCELDYKPRLNSRVIRELPTRQEILAAQGADSESRARNRRMFGSLIGTLHKFCQEESRLKQKEEKKAKIEKKLEEQEIQERENMKRERESLFIDRKRKQLEIRKLELKLNRLQDFEVWEKSRRQQNCFLLTKTKPSLFFRPKDFDRKSEKLLIESRYLLKTEIEKRRALLNEEFLEIENCFNLHEDCFDENLGNLDEVVLNSKHYKNGCRTDEEEDVTYNYNCCLSKTAVNANDNNEKDVNVKKIEGSHSNDLILTSSVVVVASTQRDKKHTSVLN